MISFIIFIFGVNAGIMASLVARSVQQWNWNKKYLPAGMGEATLRHIRADMIFNSVMLGANTLAGTLMVLVAIGKVTL